MFTSGFFVCICYKVKNSCKDTPFSRLVNSGKPDFSVDINATNSCFLRFKT